MRAKIRSSFVAIALIGCAVGVSTSAGLQTWLGYQWWPSPAPQDYEECSERAGKAASSNDERASLIAQCDQQFTGRRRPGGGYTYYDFLQDRSFDIAGPNPTPKELKRWNMKAPPGSPAVIQLGRNFLHAAAVEFKQPQNGKALALEAALPEELTAFLERLRR